MNTESDLATADGFMRKLSLDWLMLILAGLLALLLFLSIFGVFKFGQYYLRLIPYKRAMLVCMETAPNGVELMVVEKFNGDPFEPYTVSLFYKPLEEDRWYWHYLEHETFPCYWENASLEINDDMADIYYQHGLAAKFDLTDYSLYRVRGDYTAEHSNRYVTDYPLLGNPWRRLRHD